eukprot:TRINITY_DN2601_c0_g1_i4.p1 TRINITY_DN2601_c0_g1~~TRINITY_DN2601_c0_g1_i4.p1  ORF type:complete len:121 (+),score=15.06 TRINITY_DN2601_c0_g1_i4:101-463(+)
MKLIIAIAALLAVATACTLSYYEGTTCDGTHVEWGYGDCVSVPDAGASITITDPNAGTALVTVFSDLECGVEAMSERQQDPLDEGNYPPEIRDTCLPLPGVVPITINGVSVDAESAIVSC